MTLDWSRDEQRVVTFGRLYLNTLIPTRNAGPRARRRQKV